MKTPAINPAYSVRRQIPYDEWLLLRDERNALSIAVNTLQKRNEDLQAQYTRMMLAYAELQAQMHRGADEQSIQNEIEAIIREIPGNS